MGSRNWLYRGIRKFYAVIETFFVFNEKEATWVYTHLKTYLIIVLKSLQLITCKVYFNKSTKDI